MNNVNKYIYIYIFFFWLVINLRLRCIWSETDFRIVYVDNLLNIKAEYGKFKEKGNSWDIYRNEL